MEQQDNYSSPRRGHLKIFFGYASGAGKTYAMLDAAHTEKKHGTDVIVGYIRPDTPAHTRKLLKNLETLSLLHSEYKGTPVNEFDLDAAIKRHPDLILIDELAHTNADGCRHQKRYQDVRELLTAGIDVYTTVNVQNIESLNDTVASITGVPVEERIPDFIFDDADQVKLVDIEPQELIERLETGKTGFCPASSDITFTIETLTALREISLRRCADRVNKLTEASRIKSNGDYHTDEHILVCLSSSPSNAKIIRTAARMANAFKGTFTALFVETSDFSSMSDVDRQRLRTNIYLAQQLGATIETVYGDDIPFQIAEFARLSGVSKIVIGRSTVTRRHLFGKPTLTEQLIAKAPNMDVHIIPDQPSNRVSFPHRVRKHIIFSVADILKSIVILSAASCLGFLFQWLGFDESNIIIIYVLAVLVTSIVTVNRIYSLITSLVSVLIFNFLFTVPKFTLMAYGRGYPVTFVIMFICAFLTGTLTTRMKTIAKQSARAAFRTKVLFDTNQLLQQAADQKAILTSTAHQLAKLLNRDIIIYPVEKNSLKNPLAFSAGEQNTSEAYLTENERSVAEWVLKNNKHAGATTQTLTNAKCLYLAIRVSDSVYGVVGIAACGQPLDASENNILLSILGECALALENKKNAQEKEQAAILAKNEQLRANLLRAISHDLRTPLTSISGNASNLMSNGDSFDEATKQTLYLDIYDDSMWLINLVENLLSVTRLEEGRLNIHMETELVDEVIQEALRHVNRLSREHQITVTHQDDLLLAKMDARLIVQVLINLVDNAIKYTPKGSHIQIHTFKEGQLAVITVSDDGPGITDENKKQVFDMFYSGAHQIADSRRSLGLGLSLCKSIVNAHGGTIRVSDHLPHGTVFTFTLPAEEVQLHE
nr:sensor histidine kinase KdpD [uncultured Blautia sp.]